MRYVIEEVENGFKLIYQEGREGHEYEGFPGYHELVFEFEPENNISERHAFNRMVGSLRDIVGLGISDVA